MKRLVIYFTSLAIIISSFIPVHNLNQSNENTNEISYEYYTNDEDDDGGVRG